MNSEGFKGRSESHLEYFDDDLVVVGDIDGFEDLAVFPSTQFPHQLVVILVTAGEKNI